MCFNKLEEVGLRFDKICKYSEFKEDIFQDFLRYFEDTWIKGKPFYPKLWNFSEGIMKKIN